ncbi:alpha/beta hydrolase [Nocardia sp. NPDC001965]
MAVVPDVQRLLAASADAPALEALPLEQARSAVRGLTALQGKPAPVAAVREVDVAGEAGPVRMRLYWPRGAHVGSAVLVWAHGGGWIRGDLDTWETPLTVLADRTGAVVASVDYRLSPEVRFPGPLRDVLAVLRYVGDHAEELGVDANRIAVGGDSSGGNLAAGAALAVRDLDAGPRLAAQVLIHPPTDPACATPSYLQYADGYGLTRTAMRYLWSQYLPTPYAGQHHLAAPLRAQDLSGLPPAVIATAECDPVRDDGEQYAAALAAHGVPVSLRRFNGMVHAFLHHHGRVPASAALSDWIGEQLRPLLAVAQ